MSQTTQSIRRRARLHRNGFGSERTETWLDDRDERAPTASAAALAERVSTDPFANGHCRARFTSSQIDETLNSSAKHVLDRSSRSNE
jgi:hypothetical protein